MPRDNATTRGTLPAPAGLPYGDPVSPGGSGRSAAASFDGMFAALAPIGRDPTSGGYKRFAWTGEDAALREWFAAAAGDRGLTLTVDRAGNQWAWWGDPDRDGRPGVAVGSHLDSVPDGGAYDGPLGVVCALAAIDALRNRGFTPSRPVGVVNFSDEEGARFGVACVGSRVVTGTLPADRACSLRDRDGVTLAAAMLGAGHDPGEFGADAEAVRRIGVFVELHVEQGRGLVELGRPIGVASAIWPHGRWRFDLAGEANHAGTTRLDDRRDPMAALVDLIATADAAARARECLATVGRLDVAPNAVNAIASRVSAWLDARGASEQAVRQVVDEVAAACGTTAVEESFTAATAFDTDLVRRLAARLGDAPVLATGAGHDAGILSAAGVPAAMLFVRNPTGVSHSPEEFAERDDCMAGVEALATVIEDLAG
jgi:beta-ureidopropionase / N-carbamoyl-L-amino-acid hydrolase